MTASKSSSYNIYHDLVIESPAENVFNAISEPQELVHWWPQKCTVEDEIYNFYFTDEYNWYGKIIESIPGKSFHIKMTKSDPDWDSTSFGFDLEEDNHKTIVHFSHTGWPACNQHFKIASYCWAILLKGLKDYVEKGIIIPFEERN